MKCGGHCGVWCVVCCMTVIFPRTRGERREAGAGGTNHRQRRETDRTVERGERRQGDSQSVSEGERWSTFTCTRSQSLTPRPRRDWTLRWTSCWRVTTGPLLLLLTSTLRILTIFTPHHSGKGSSKTVQLYKDYRRFLCFSINLWNFDPGFQEKQFLWIANKSITIEKH